MKDRSASRYERLSYDKVLSDKLNVMDATSIVLCRDNGLPIRIFDLNLVGALVRVARGDDVGTLVAED
jgi:uridylate kinase